MEGLVIRAADDRYAPRALGSLAARIELWAAGSLWAQSGPLTPDSTTATIAAAVPLEIPEDRPLAIEIRWVPRAGVASGRVRLGCDREGIVVLQPSSALLRVQVLPVEGQAFPLWSEPGGFEPVGLSASYKNFPNPFAAGRQWTRFVYYLEAPGRVSLRIMTLHGEGVAALLNGVARGPGLYQNDLWDGRNGRGELVWNGVYAAELLVLYDDGRTEKLLRKVAVLR